MVYVKSKPDSAESPQLDAPTIQGNFSTYATVFANNHTAMNIPAQGDHEKIIFERQTVDPGISSNIDILYNRNATSNVGTQPQLFVRIPQFLPKTPDWTQNENTRMQLTYNTVNLAGPQYQSFLPGTIDANAPTLTGAYIIYMGQIPYSSPATVILSPIPTLIRAVLVTPIINNTLSNPRKYNVNVNNTLHDRFTITSTSSSGFTAPDFWGYVVIATV